MKLLNADFLDISKSFEDKSFDIVFTSPPFKEEDVDGKYWDLYDLWMQEIFRLTDKVAIIIHSSTKINTVISKYPPKRVLIWGKGISKYSYRWNPIYVYELNNDYKVNKHIYTDAFGVQSVLNNWKVHKYQDPPGLYYAVLKMFKDCKTVLDPFMGSGTTYLACEQLGLEFTGIEKDLDMFNNAKEFLSKYKFNPETFSLEERNSHGAE